MKRRPCRGKFEKDTPMVMIYHERKDAGKPDRTLFEVVPRDDKNIADRVQEKLEEGSTVYTDEFRAYSTPEERGLDHHTVNHSKGDYAHGEGNCIHTNNAECRVGLLKFWLKNTAESASGTLNCTSRRFNSYTTTATTTWAKSTS